MTNDDWKFVENTLSGIYGSVNFKIDGYTVTVKRTLIKGNKLTNMVYVNGRFKGVWTSADCEERRRFLRERSKSFYTKKDVAKIKRIFGKKSDIYKKSSKPFKYYTPFWDSVRSMKKHFIKNNKSIELVRS